MRFEYRAPRPFMGPTGRQLVIRRTSSKYKIQLRVPLTGFLHLVKPRERFQMALALVLIREAIFIRVRSLRTADNLFVVLPSLLGPQGLSEQLANILLEWPRGFDFYLS